jgi:hypothetical protein
MFQRINGMLTGAVNVARRTTKNGASAPNIKKYSPPRCAVRIDGFGKSGRLRIRSRMVAGKSTVLRKLMFSE